MKKYTIPAIELHQIGTTDNLLLQASPSQGGGPQLVPGKNIFEQEGEELPESPDLWKE